jgi:hypothetical protein
MTGVHSSVGAFRRPTEAIPDTRRAWTGRLWPAIAWAAAAAAAFAVYLRLAQTRAVNSDGASQALQAWDMLHGNPLLRGWTTSDVSFYTTELPQYALVELVRGLRADVVDIAAAMTYTLAVLLAALLAKGTATGRPGMLRVALAAGIMLAPQPASGTDVLLSSPDHIGTSVPLLLTWLVIDRAEAAGRPRWYVPVITSALLWLAETADSLVLVAGIMPLALVATARAGLLARARPAGWRRAAGYQLALAGGGLVAAGAARWTLRAVTAAGGFTVRPLGTGLAPLDGVFRHNVPMAGQCLLLLFGADTGGAGGGQWPGVLVLHLAGVALAAAGVAVAVIGVMARSREGLVSQVLLAAIAVNLGAFLVTQRVIDLSSAREIAPVLPFAAALAGRRLGPLLSRAGAGAGTGTGASSIARPIRLRRLLAGLLVLAGAGYLAGLGAELTTPAAPPQAAGLTAWLTAHRLPGTGLAGFWQASVVTLTSGGQVAVRPIADQASAGQASAGQSAATGVGPHPGETSAAWFDPRRSAAHFVVLAAGQPGYPGFSDERAVLATWGAPARVYQDGRYTIWYWPANLLLRLGG